jgi:hypothetical protein
MVITFAIEIDALHAINEIADTNKHAVFLFRMRRFILKMSPARSPSSAATPAGEFIQVSARLLEEAHECALDAAQTFAHAAAQ